MNIRLEMGALVLERLELHLASVAGPSLGNINIIILITTAIININIVVITDNFLIGFWFLNRIVEVLDREFGSIIGKRRRWGVEEAAGIEEILREFEYGTMSFWLVWLFFCWLIYSARHRRPPKPSELNLRLYIGTNSRMCFDCVMLLLICVA